MDALDVAARNGARPWLGQKVLQQPGGAETRDRIGYRHWLTLEDPARHRNAQCRITQMHEFHSPTPRRTPTRGEIRVVSSHEQATPALSAGPAHESARRGQEGHPEVIRDVSRVASLYREDVRPDLENPATADDGVAVVEDGGLAGSQRALGIVEGDEYFVGAG